MQVKSLMRLRTQFERVAMIGAACWLAACGGGGAQPTASAEPNLGYVPIAAAETPTAVDASTIGRSASAMAAKPAGPRLYIVQMAEAPMVAYTGGVAGYAATKVQKGTKVNANHPDVVRYLSYLTARHDATVAAAGGRKAYSYGTVFNGFAAHLTDAQALRLASTKGVLSVVKDERRALDTSSTPSFLGLDAPGGLWEQLGGPLGTDGPQSRGAGEGMVVGIIDSGVWPEHPSFSDRDATGKRVYRQLPGWNGRCIPGEAFNASMCNQKLIGARHYSESFGGDAALNAELPFEFMSARDFGGHGTHTASTAAGNHGVTVTGDYSALGKISGIAPRARIAAYKVCWEFPEGGCGNADSVAAIDQAVLDGVDVINYSISGSRTNFRDPVELAFLFAADAGVFVAVSAGNSGPTASTVAHPGPWLTTVAAGTHNRNGEGTLTLGNGVSYTGASFVGAVLQGPLVDAVNALAPATPTTQPTALDAELCAPGSLDPVKIVGRIVLCKRGGYALVDKTGEVARGGGIGAIIYNDPVGATNTLAIVHSVPTVHVASGPGLDIKAYIASAGSSATVTLNRANVVYNVPAPTTASFSSRGPLIAGGGDLLKPDLMAPGQDVLAAVAPPGNGGSLYSLYSGTSMSSPHVAGLAALLKSKHPTWSPMAIKSALMTSAADVLDATSVESKIFRQGAGHVRPNIAAVTGLVYDSGFVDWLGFLCGTQLPVATCTGAGVPVLDASNLNSASIAVGDLAGFQTVTRRLTNVTGKALSVSASVTGLGGLSVVVTPSQLTIPAGGTASFTVTFTNSAAPVDVYVGGNLTWTGSGQTLRSPIIVRPVALAAPTQVSASYKVVFGYTGPFATSARGMVPATPSSHVLAQDPDASFDRTDAVGSVAVPVVIPAGTTYFRASTFAAETATGSDLDLYVYNPAGALVASSGGGTSDEEANLINPAAGTYTVYLHGYAVPGGSMTVPLSVWTLGDASIGNMVVTAPSAATVGGTGNIALSFSGLLSGKRYLGSVVYAGATGLPRPTIVRVDAP